MPRSAKNHRRFGDPLLGLIAKAGWTVLADADKSEPALN